MSETEAAPETNTTTTTPETSATSTSTPAATSASKEPVGARKSSVGSNSGDAAAAGTASQPATPAKAGNGKCFIGGLSWDTTEQTLRNYFSQYGELSDVVIMKDKNTGNSRGFAFVTFLDPDVAVTMSKERHLVDGRQVEAKIAVPREEMGARAFKTRKIFVGGIPISLTEEEFSKYFEKFGTILESMIMYDHQTGRSRGFGFVTFDSEHVVETILNQTHDIGGKTVEIKKAEPKKSVGGSNNVGRGGGVRVGYPGNSYNNQSVPPNMRNMVAAMNSLSVGEIGMGGLGNLQMGVGSIAMTPLLMNDTPLLGGNQHPGGPITSSGPGQQGLQTNPQNVPGGVGGGMALGGMRMPGPGPSFSGSAALMGMPPGTFGPIGGGAAFAGDYGYHEGFSNQEHLQFQQGFGGRFDQFPNNGPNDGYNQVQGMVGGHPQMPPHPHHQHHQQHHHQQHHQHHQQHHQHHQQNGQQAQNQGQGQAPQEQYGGQYGSS